MKLVKNVLLILIGLVIIGIGASTLRVAGLGVDPFTAMNIGLSSMFGMQLGIFQIIVNAFILFYVYLKNKKSHWSRNYFKYAFSRNFDSTDFYLASTLRQ